MKRFALGITFLMLLCQCGFVTTYGADDAPVKHSVEITGLTFDDKTIERTTNFDKGAQISFPVEIAYKVELDENEALMEILFDFEVTKDGAALSDAVMVNAYGDPYVDYVYKKTVSIKNKNAGGAIAEGSYLHKLKVTMPDTPALKSEYGIKLINVRYNVVKTEDGKTRGSVYFHPTVPGHTLTSNGKAEGPLSEKAVDIRIGQYNPHDDPDYLYGDVYFRYYVYLETIPAGGPVETAKDLLQNWLKSKEKNGGTEYAASSEGWMQNVKTTVCVLNSPVTFSDGTVANAYLDITFSEGGGNKRLDEKETLVTLDFSKFTTANMYPRTAYSNAIYWKRNNEEILIYGTDPANTQEITGKFVPEEFNEVTAVATFYGPEPAGYIEADTADFTKGPVGLAFIETNSPLVGVTVVSVTVYEADGTTVKEVIPVNAPASAYSYPAGNNGRHVFAVTAPNRPEGETFEFEYDLRLIDRIPPITTGSTSSIPGDTEHRKITLSVSDPIGSLVSSPNSHPNHPSVSYHPLDVTCGSVMVTRITCDGSDIGTTGLSGSAGSSIFTLNGELGKTYIFTVTDALGNETVYTVEVPDFVEPIDHIDNVKLNFDSVDEADMLRRGENYLRLLEKGRFQAVLDFSVVTDVTSLDFTSGSVTIKFNNTAASNFRILNIVGSSSYPWISIGSDKKSLVIAKNAAAGAMGEGDKTLKLIIDIDKPDGTPAPIIGNTPSISIESVEVKGTRKMLSPEAKAELEDLESAGLGPEDDEYIQILEDPDSWIYITIDTLYDDTANDIPWENDIESILNFLIVDNPKIK